jgi:hypothetical protein
LGVNILLYQPAEVLAAVHAAAGGLRVHRIFEFQGRSKRQGNKLFAFGGLISGFAGHFVFSLGRKILFGNIELQVK